MRFNLVVDNPERYFEVAHMFSLHQDILMNAKVSDINAMKEVSRLLGDKVVVPPSISIDTSSSSL